MRKTTITFIFLFFTFLCLSKNEITKKDSISTTKIDKPISQSEVTYELLYKNQVDANDDILKTIFYALGGLGSAMLFVFASNWWFNEKKVNDIKAGISTQIESENSKLAATLRSEINLEVDNLKTLNSDFMEIIRKEIRENNNQLLTNYQSQLSSFSNNINVQISTLKTSFDERIEVIQKQLEINDKEAKRLIGLNKEKLDKTERRLKINILRNDAELWLIRGVPLNAFNCYIEEGQLSLEIGYDWNFEYVIKDLEDTAKKLTFIRANTVTDCQALFSKISSAEFEDQKRNIIELISKVEVFE